MTAPPPSLVTTPHEVIERLEAARVPGPSGLAFDADGTLWSGDVGEDVFEWACNEELLRGEAEEALVRAATIHGVSPDGSPSELATALYAGYRSGRVTELVMCEIMTWCYAGFSEAELRHLARRAFSARKLAGRRREILTPVFDWAARAALRVIVVSASPFPIVAEGLALVGIEASCLGAARAEQTEDHVILPALADPVPYAAQKPVVGRRLLAGHDWLGSFGDNAFDVDMLRAARVGVAVCPKPALNRRLHELTNTVVLDAPPARSPSPTQ